MPAKLDLLLSEPIATINPNIYGHFIEHLGACIYDGLWLPNQGLCPEVISALKQINPPIIRWPGGCFADDYHWQDGIGPPNNRPKRVNLHWGSVIESNHFGAHEFIQFCRTLGAQPYISGNVGSGSPRELRDWVEYCNHSSGSTLSDLRRTNGAEQPFNVQFWGVGNEPWGCGGHFTPEDYAAEYRRFATYLLGFGDTPLHLIAAGPDGNDLDWTRRFFEKLMSGGADTPVHHPSTIHAFAAHYYCGTAGTATDYTDAQWYELLHKAAKIEDLILQQRALMDQFDPHRRISLIIDEWGAWHPPTPGRNPAFLWQQNTLRDAFVAAITLNIFNRHADKIAMANIAQTLNVLQALLLTENGKLIRTPTYHVYDLYKNHQGARSIRIESASDLSTSASLKNTTLTLTVVNSKIAEPAETQINLHGSSAILIRQTILTDPDIHAHNTFTEPTRLIPSDPRVLPLRGHSFPFTFPPQSLTRLEMSLA
ncbi:MAG TPA: alpha-L-arabinofuranosidase C-terminal domain-containing protein [Tepidisphaeraceae bacterium]|jgi:alpha-N-arabinofuranosidase|nr:alpha-L-arabinofuranosidase C-terminal domain-containing protein [Tepidisphaeraceae bacterium]